MNKFVFVKCKNISDRNSVIVFQTEEKSAPKECEGKKGFKRKLKKSKKLSSIFLYNKNLMFFLAKKRNLNDDINRKNEKFSKEE